MTTSSSPTLFEQNQHGPEQEPQLHANNSDLHSGEQQTERCGDLRSQAPATLSLLAQGAPQTGRSPFRAATVEVVLQLLPEDGHSDGRRIRYALTIDGKTLVIGARRVNAFFARCAECTNGGAEQVLALLEQYIATCQQHLQQTFPQKATSSLQSASRSTIASMPPQPAQAQWPPQSAPTDRAVHPVSRPTPASAQEKPQQLELF